MCSVLHWPLPATHLGAAVLPSAPELCELLPVLVEVSGGPKVNEFTVETLVDQHVLVFDVSVEDSVAMEKLNTFQDLSSQRGRWSISGNLLGML